MATITIDFPNADAVAIRDDLCEYGGYSQTLIDGSPNPVTRAQFAKQVAAQAVRDCVRLVRIARLKAATAEPDIT